MITRVRGRLRSFQALSKLDPQIQNEKIAETGKHSAEFFIVIFYGIINFHNNIDNN